MTHLIGTILVHPDDNPRDPTARRVMYRAVTPGEWPWMRITGMPVDIPGQGGDFGHWREQFPGDFAVVCGHRTVLSGYEVGG